MVYGVGLFESSSHGEIVLCHVWTLQNKHSKSQSWNFHINAATSPLMCCGLQLLKTVFPHQLWSSRWLRVTSLFYTIFLSLRALLLYVHFTETNTKFNQLWGGDITSDVPRQTRSSCKREKWPRNAPRVVVTQLWFYGGNALCVWVLPPFVVPFILTLYRNKQRW